MQNNVQYVYDDKPKLDVALDEKLTQTSIQSGEYKAKQPRRTYHAKLQSAQDTARRYVMANDSPSTVQVGTRHYTERQCKSLGSWELEGADCISQITEEWEEPTKSRVLTIFKPLLKLADLIGQQLRVLRQYNQNADRSIVRSHLRRPGKAVI